MLLVLITPASPGATVLEEQKRRLRAPKYEATTCSKPLRSGDISLKVLSIVWGFTVVFL